MNCADSMALLAYYRYGGGGGVRIEAMGPEAKWSRWAVPWRDEHKPGLHEPPRRAGRRGSSGLC